MNKDEINFNLNKSVAIKSAGIGACLWPILYSAPFLITHPSIQNIIPMLLPAFFMYDFYTRLKAQNYKNKEIIKKYRIKDYKTPVPSALCSGLIGAETLTFLVQATTNPTKMNIFLFAFSTPFLTAEIVHLKNLINHNKQQIDKIK